MISSKSKLASELDFIKTILIDNSYPEDSFNYYPKQMYPICREYHVQPSKMSSIFESILARQQFYMFD